MFCDRVSVLRPVTCRSSKTAVECSWALLAKCFACGTAMRKIRAQSRTVIVGLQNVSVTSNKRAVLGSRGKRKLFVWWSDGIRWCRRLTTKTTVKPLPVSSWKSYRKPQRSQITFMFGFGRAARGRSAPSAITSVRLAKLISERAEAELCLLQSIKLSACGTRMKHHEGVMYFPEVLELSKNILILLRILRRHHYCQLLMGAL